MALCFGLFLIAMAGSAAAGQCTMPEGAKATLEAVMDGVNKARRAKGRASLQREALIDTAAQGHACTMAQKAQLSHDGGGGPKRRMRKAGCKARTTGEAIATGQRNAAEVVQSWMESPPHRAILLLSAAKKVGLGLAYSPKDKRLYWVFDVANDC